MREDAIRLYGFASELEREWFRLLMTVQSVGTRVAIAILGVLKPSDLATAIALQDKASLGRAPGVGKKVADRIIAELRDKAPAYSSADPLVVGLQSDLAEQKGSAGGFRCRLGPGQPRLCSDPSECRSRRGITVCRRGCQCTETLIRLGLKELAR